MKLQLQYFGHLMRRADSLEKTLMLGGIGGRLEFRLQHHSFNEYSGLISFRMDWFDLLAVQGTLKSLLQHHSSKTPILQLERNPQLSLATRGEDWAVMPSSHLILCHPLFLLPLIPPSIRVFSNESALLMRWPK